MSYSTNAGQRRRHHLYDEFASFYSQERCPWAPANPRRVFNLAFKAVYPPFRKHLAPSDFLGTIYATLGAREGNPSGLFQTYDPKKYNGTLAAEDHFVNHFKAMLRGKVLDSLKRTTDNGRPGDPAKFRPRPELGITREARGSAWEPRMADNVAVGLALLDDTEQAVIRLRYWADLSDRKIGALLGVDHKTVGGRHKQALRKLRLFFGAEAVAA